MHYVKRRFLIALVGEAKFAVEPWYMEELAVLGS